MALKDWKQVENTKISFAFKNKKNENDFVTAEIVNFQNRHLWEVKTLRIRTELFRTKTRALKFARQYMRIR